MNDDNQRFRDRHGAVATLTSNRTADARSGDTSRRVDMPLRTLPPPSLLRVRYAGRLELLYWSRRCARRAEIISRTLLSAALNYSTFNQLREDTFSISRKSRLS